MDSIDFCLWNEVVKHLDSPSYIAFRFTCKPIMKAFPIHKLKKSPLRDCALFSYLSLAKWLYGIGFELVPKVSLIASRSNNVEFLDWYLSCNGYLSDWITTYAARGGAIEAYQWAISHDCSPIHIEFEATIHGKLEFLKFYLANNENTEEAICNYAGYYGHVELLDWLLQNGYTINMSSNYVSPLNKNYQEIIPILDKYGQPMHPNSDSYAAQLSIDVLKWTNKDGNYTIRQITSAVRAGKIDVVRYLMSTGLRPLNQYIEIASYGGHLEMVKFLHEQGLPLTQKAFLDAKNIGLVEWFLEQGYKIDDEFLSNVSDPELLKWLYNKGYKLDFKQLFENAVSTEILDWLHNLGYRYPDDILESAVYNDSGKRTKWLINNGYKSGENLLELAIDEYCTCCIKYLVMHGYTSERLIKHLYDNGVKDIIFDAVRLGHPVPKDIYSYKLSKNQIRWLVNNDFAPNKKDIISITDVNVLRTLLSCYVTD